MVRGTAMTMETLTIISRESEFLWPNVAQKKHPAVNVQKDYRNLYTLQST